MSDQLQLMQVAENQRSLAGLEGFVAEKWTAPDEYPRLWDAKRIAIDLETRDPGLEDKGAGWATGNGEIVGYGFATDEGQWYFPVGHEAGGNLDPKITKRWVKKVLASNSQKIFFNQNYDEGWLQREGFKVEGECFDGGIAAPLLDEYRRGRYSLEHLSQDWLGEGKDEVALESFAKMARVPKSDIKANLWRFPASVAGWYGEADPGLHLRLWDHCKKRLNDEGLWDIYCLEQRLVKMLIAMRMRGVRVDLAWAEKLKTQLQEKYLLLMGSIQEEFAIKLDGPQAKGDLVYACEKLGIDVPETDQGNPSMVKAWIDNHPHPFFRKLSEIREADTLVSLLDTQIFNIQVDGRVHPSFHQLPSDKGGAVTGRFSCSLPNLQNVPARDPYWGPRIRAIFVPEEHKQWLKADYSQQEYRLIVHYSLLMRLSGSREAARAYMEADADFHQIVADMTGLPRAQAKNLNFGMAYNMGAPLLAESLGITIEEALPLLELYHEKAPFMRALASKCSNRAQRKGYVRTILGRHCRFPLWEPASTKNNRDEGLFPLPREEAEVQWPEQTLKRGYTYRAMNKVIQGSAADMTKKAMADLWDEEILPGLQVHDELDFPDHEPGDDKRIAMITEIMNNAVPLKIPCPVDCWTGPNWGNFAEAC